MTDSKSTTTQDTAHLTQPTVAGGLYVLILAAAAIIRFAALGNIPLSPVEADNALGSWMLWQPGAVSYHVISPAYFSLTSLITPIVGYSDAVMRFVPAVFGLGTVAVTWLLRHQLGLSGKLVLALFLSISPLNGVVARTAGGDSIAEFSVVLLLVAWLRYQEAGETRWLSIGAAALGLGLASSTLFYSGLLTMMSAGLLQRWLGPQWPVRQDAVRLEAANWRQAALVGGTVSVAVSTLFLWHPAGFGVAVALPVQWLSQFSIPNNGALLLNPLLAAGRFELLLLLPGAVAIIWAIRQEKTLGTFGVYWIGTIIGLILLQQGQVDNALLLTLPGYLLLASFTDHVLAPRIHQATWLLAAGLSLAASLILINVARYSRIVIFQPEQMANIWMAVLVFAITLVVVYYAANWDVKALSQGILIGTLTLAAIYYWGTSWWLGHQAANDPRERWVGQSSDDEVIVLREVVKDISRQVTGTDFGLEILSAADSPVLHWYLRDFRQMEKRGVLPADPRSPVIINWANSETLLTNDYVGADFGLLRTGWQPKENPNSRPALDTIRWWFFHDSDQLYEEQRVILWWRADLAQDPN